MREAVETDLAEIVEIYNSTISSLIATADTEPVSIASRRPWFDGHSSRRPLWVVEERGRILAWLSIHPFNVRPAYHATVEISVYVAEGQRRRGIGRRLLQHAVNQAPRLGINNLVAFVFAHNHFSRRLFDNCGFQRWGYLPRVAELGGRERDVIVYGLRVRENCNVLLEGLSRNEP
ncbi:MAG: N-acetyltransferase family protein [Syntrophomonadaceae bacterium]|nr:N-acetyltransferase family protein [Syntrophomonadaceae bacterium]